MTLRLAVIGTGRLGREILDLAPQRDASVVATYWSKHPIDEAALRTSDVHVVIDVSVAEAVPGNVAACLGAGLPIVIGVTGWQDVEADVLARVHERAGSVLVAPNFSIGATLFGLVVADAAQRFSAALGFDAALVETHHVMKKDAPSGTARALAEAVRERRGADVPVTSVRVGHVPGVHSLILDAPFEQVTLTHEARDRRVFADGAIRAARWLQGRTGHFTMVDVVRDITGAQG